MAARALCGRTQPQEDSIMQTLESDDEGDDQVTALRRCPV